MDTDKVGRTQVQHLINIIRNCNSHDIDLVSPYHLNVPEGNGHDVEVLYFEQKDLAVLKGTKVPTILIEFGFIDNDSYMVKWNVDKIANFIVYALTI